MAEPDLSNLPEVDDTGGDTDASVITEDVRDLERAQNDEDRRNSGFGPWAENPKFPDQTQAGYTDGPDVPGVAPDWAHLVEKAGGTVVDVVGKTAGRSGGTAPIPPLRGPDGTAYPGGPASRGGGGGGGGGGAAAVVVGGVVVVGLGVGLALLLSSRRKRRRS